MIKAVTFDVWETMIRDSTAVSEARSALRVERMAQVLHQAGYRVGEDAVRAAYDRSWPSYAPIWATGREVTPREQIEMLVADFDGTITGRLGPSIRAALEDAYVQPIFDEPPLLNEGLVDVLWALRSQRIRLGLICNTGRTPGYAMRRLLGDYGVLGFFEALAFSDEEAIRKPDPRIFLRVLRDLDVPPPAAMHLGDDLVTDIGGAKGAGMRAILIRADYPINVPVPPDAHITDLDQLLEAMSSL